MINGLAETVNAARMRRLSRLSHPISRRVCETVASLRLTTGGSDRLTTACFCRPTAHTVPLFRFVGLQTWLRDALTTSKSAGRNSLVGLVAEVHLVASPHRLKSYVTVVIVAMQVRLASDRFDHAHLPYHYFLERHNNPGLRFRCRLRQYLVVIAELREHPSKEFP